MSKCRDEVLEFSARLLRPAEGILQSLPAMVEANGVDALLIDAVQIMSSWSDAIGHTVYTHSNALHLDYTGYTLFACMVASPDYPQLSPETERGCKICQTARQAQCWRQSVRKDAGLKIDWEDLGSTLSPLARSLKLPRIRL